MFLTTHNSKYRTMNLNNVTFNEIVGVDTNTPQVRTAVNTTAQALSRFYNGLYLIRQSFAHQLDLPETVGLMQVTIQKNLIEPLAQQFHEFRDFQFEITERGSIIGKNDTANTILYALQQVAMTPVAEHTHHTLPEHKKILEDMAAAQALDVDDDYDYDDDYDDDSYD